MFLGWRSLCRPLTFAVENALDLRQSLLVDFQLVRVLGQFIIMLVAARCVQPLVLLVAQVVTVQVTRGPANVRRQTALLAVHTYLRTTFLAGACCLARLVAGIAIGVHMRQQPAFVHGDGYLFRV